MSVMPMVFGGASALLFFNALMEPKRVNGVHGLSAAGATHLGRHVAPRRLRVVGQLGGELLEQRVAPQFAPLLDECEQPRVGLGAAQAELEAAETEWLELEMLKEDSKKLRAKDLHELLRAWENYHRILTAEAHMKHIQFREESRYPGFYYRTDKNFVDEENWHCFVNSVYDKNTKKWTCFKRKHVDLVDKSKLFKAAAPH